MEIGSHGVHDEPVAAEKRATPHRRALLAGLTGLTGAALLPPAPARATTAPHLLKVGALDVTVVSDGHLQVPVSFQLPDTPGEEVDALFTANGLPPPRRFTPPTNVTLVRTGGEVVLIDAGSGSTFQDTAGKLADNLEAAGIDRESVTTVVFTHAHADHLWGAIDDFDDRERFPNARYVISPAEWDFWTEADAPARMPDFLRGLARGSERVLKRLEPKMERRRAGEAVAPGLTFVSTPGHTPGHMAVLIESGREQALVGGDALTHAQISFQRPAWPIASDTDRDLAAATRTRLLDRLTADRTPLIGFHLPWPGLGCVERSGATHRFVPA